MNGCLRGSYIVFILVGRRTFTSVVLAKMHPMKKGRLTRGDTVAILLDMNNSMNTPVNHHQGDLSSTQCVQA